MYPPAIDRYQHMPGSISPVIDRVEPLAGDCCRFADSLSQIRSVPPAHHNEAGFLYLFLVRLVYDIDERTAKPENDLQYKYLRFKNFNIDKLVKNAAANEIDQRTQVNGF